MLSAQSLRVFDDCQPSTVPRPDMVDVQFHSILYSTPANHAPIFVARENFPPLFRCEIFKCYLCDRFGIVPVDALPNLDEKSSLIQIPNRTPRISWLSSIEVEVPIFDIIDHRAMFPIHVGVICEILLYQI